MKLRKSSEPGKRLRAQAKPALPVNGVDADAAKAHVKAHVMAHFRRLVADGSAEWRTLDDGTTQLSLNTGEIYLLEQTDVTRVA
ncbi:MAG: hypothetical protein KGK16_09890 [Bradyrhizobium sp.]|nr:hypothetical protein [Bradyrhizobium sp.]